MYYLTYLYQYTSKRLLVSKATSSPPTQFSFIVSKTRLPTDIRFPCGYQRHEQCQFCSCSQGCRPPATLANLGLDHNKTPPFSSLSLTQGRERQTKVGVTSTSEAIIQVGNEQPAARACRGGWGECASDHYLPPFLLID